MGQTNKTLAIIMPLGAQQGGAEALLHHLLVHGMAHFKIVCAFFQQGSLETEARRLGFETIFISATRLSHPRDYLRTVLTLRRWFGVHQPDIILSWMPKAHLYAGIAALGLRSKVVWYQHGVPERDKLDRLATLVPANAVLCCSRTAQSYQDKIYPKRGTFVCYPGVQIPVEPLRTSDQAKRELGLATWFPVICMVARLERWKGVHILLAASEFIFTSFPKAFIVVIGGAHPLDVGFAEEMRSGASMLSRPNQFLLAGQRTMAETRHWQAAADLIVHPVTGIEAFGMAVPEAMSHGKVVIASREGGPAEIIEHGINGVLIDKADPVRLAQAVVETMADQVTYIALSQAAAKRAQQFSIQAFTKRIDFILSQIAID